MFLDVNLAQFNAPTLAVFAVLGIMSLIALSLFFFKLTQFFRLGVGRRREADTILRLWLSGDALRASAVAENRRSVLGRILHAVLTGLQARPEDPRFAEELGRQAALTELASMKRWMMLLDMIVQAAPMLGLLGTVIGMIESFQAMSAGASGIQATDLAGGIYVALSTTAMGLAIALVAYFIATFFEGRIDRERDVMETYISGALHGRVEQIANSRL